VNRTRTISIEVSKMAGDVFDTILELSPKIISDLKNKPLGILNHQYVDEEPSWNIPMCVISNGDLSKIIIILKQPEQLSDLQFDQRVCKISNIVTSMKHILESDV
jgi:hypothetical protein